MATKRQRSPNSWEFVVKRKGLFPKPLYLTFANEKDGDAYVARLEALLDRGIVPEEFRAAYSAGMLVIGDAIREYLVQHAVQPSDRSCLGVLYARVGSIPLAKIDYSWVEAWVTGMKRERVLSPSTIRHYVGALARCFDWAGRRGAPIAPNPLRALPKRYATYSEADKEVVKVQNKLARADGERDRRLDSEEEARIRLVLAGNKREGKERSHAQSFQGALELLFDLALETAMRLREMYTLTLDQIDLQGRTVFLDRTKNGDKRQVPLSSVALTTIQIYLKQVQQDERGMQLFAHHQRKLFPWWSGDNNHAELKRVTSQLSRQFARIFDAAGCPDLRFHDLRHEATSRLYERTKLSDVQIAKITGHKDLRMLSRYANLRGSNLADQLW